MELRTMSSSKIIGVRVEVMEGDRVVALNYRKRPAVWEAGECIRVAVRIFSESRHEVMYYVLLDGSGPEKDAPGRTITVKGSDIKPYDEPTKGLGHVPIDKLR